MKSVDELKSAITTGYTFEGISIVLGTAIHEKQPVAGAQVKVPLNTVNRHGLIAGATGTGKTKPFSNSQKVFLKTASMFYWWT